ncbi:MAG: hypothetical protein R3F60_01720 [bacterium]
MHGERRPESAISRRTWSAAFLLVARQNDTVDARAVEQVDNLRQSWERAFERAATAPGYPGPDLLTTLDGSREDPPPSRASRPASAACAMRTAPRGPITASGWARGVGLRGHLYRRGALRRGVLLYAFAARCAGRGVALVLHRGGRGGALRGGPFDPMPDLPPDAAVDAAVQPEDAGVSPDQGGDVVLDGTGGGGGDEGCRQSPGGFGGHPALWLVLGLPLLRRRRRR